MTSNLEKVAVLATIACVLKFLVEGVTFTLFGSLVNLGHVDSMTYTALLAPLWASHGYIKGKSNDKQD
jgi:hypothetical protein